MIIRALAVNAAMLQDKTLFDTVVAKFVTGNNDMPQIEKATCQRCKRCGLLDVRYNKISILYFH